MARKLRIHYPGATYHVLLRGNAGVRMFFDAGDRYRFCLILQYAVEKFGCRGRIGARLDEARCRIAEKAESQT